MSSWGFRLSVRSQSPFQMLGGSDCRCHHHAGGDGAQSEAICGLPKPPMQHSTRKYESTYDVAAGGNSHRRIDFVRAATPKPDATHLRIVALLHGESDYQGQTPKSLNLNQRFDLSLAAEAGDERLRRQIVAQQRAIPRRRQGAIQQPLLSADEH